MKLRRRMILQLMGLGAAAGMMGGCDSIGSVFGRMFAMPPRDTHLFHTEQQILCRQLSGFAVHVHATHQMQWRLSISGEVKHPMTLGWRDVSPAVF